MCNEADAPAENQAFRWEARTAILFADIDGVLHPTPIAGRYGDIDLFSSLHLLEEVLRQAPFVQVVISSSWRRSHPLDEIREYFSEDLRNRILDVTPVQVPGPISAELREYHRHAECLAWLVRNRAGTAWIAVDDDPKLWAPGCANLFFVDPRTGLTADSARGLLARLQALRKAP